MAEVGLSVVVVDVDYGGVEVGIEGVDLLMNDEATRVGYVKVDRHEQHYFLLPASTPST